MIIDTKKRPDEKFYIYAEIFYRNADGENKVKQIWNASVLWSLSHKESFDYAVMQSLKKLCSEYVWERKTVVNYKFKKSHFENSPHY